MTDALKFRAINPCSTDSCVFVSKNLIILVYVDDVLIFSKKELWIEMFIKLLAEGKEILNSPMKAALTSSLELRFKTTRPVSMSLNIPT